MKFVPVKTAEHFDLPALYGIGERLVAQRWGHINQIRAFAAGAGGQGRPVPARSSAPALPSTRWGPRARPGPDPFGQQGWAPQLKKGRADDGGLECARIVKTRPASRRLRLATDRSCPVEISMTESSIEVAGALPDRCSA